MKTTIAVLAVAAIFLVLGAIDYSEALTQEAIEKEQRPLRAARPVLSHPIPYRAVVCQSGPLEKPRCRFYTGERIK